ncbi:WYL domain-containing protein [Kibdelosporangium philippinense]|uniref:WYL domain-containing protein n=1 Tax=Kibdelosporangium philippinense TaxID=211113 RepID=A0ABS8ZL52_9PSEU|nr:WYL domain-containing protein [Kibdelosporangium philippinense]MCE7008509.1 WYL domain-containing protein [Kibdelosporangium philippinense]
MPTRLLRLLSLLHSRPEWSGGELAAELDITTRTVRRDVERLRQLDYVIEATTGTAGGYRLISSPKLPPPHLDESEAIALMIRAGTDEDAMRALTKLIDLLPARQRPRLAVLKATTTAIRRPVPNTDPAVIATLALGCRESEILTFEYFTREGSPSSRRVEPHSIVTVEGRWYLLGFDIYREDWRTFRLDRISEPMSTRHRFTPRELPAKDAATYLTESMKRASYQHTALITVPLSAESVRARIFAPIPGTITENHGTCTIQLSASNAELITQYVAAIAALSPIKLEAADEEIHQRLRKLGTELISSGSWRANGPGHAGSSRGSVCGHG